MKWIEIGSWRFVDVDNELGRRYDHNGNMTMWWSESLLKEFQIRADCFIQQYSALTIDNINKKVSNYPLILINNSTDSGQFPFALYSNEGLCLFIRSTLGLEQLSWLSIRTETDNLTKSFAGRLTETGLWGRTFVTVVDWLTHGWPTRTRKLSITTKRLTFQVSTTLKTNFFSSIMAR